MKYLFLLVITVVFSLNDDSDTSLNRLLESELSTVDELFEVDETFNLKGEVGEHKTNQNTISMPGFDCGGGNLGNGAVKVFWPTDLENGPFPIVSFLHGSGSGNFGRLCHSIASLGIVVVAPQQGTCGDWTMQQMHAVSQAESTPELHIAFSHVNYKSVGVAGHSRGAAYSMGSAAFSGSWYIKAAVASHGQSGNAAPHMPVDMAMMYNAGTSDPKTHKLWWSYSATQSRPKVFYNLHGANHMEPAHSGHSCEFMAHFLACYTIPSQYSCDKIYGDGPDTMCHKYGASCSWELPEPVTPTIGYRMGPLGSQCPSDAEIITDYRECERALVEVGAARADIMHEDKTSSYPAGCSYATAANEPYFNVMKHADDATERVDIQPICKILAGDFPSHSPTKSSAPTTSPSAAPTRTVMGYYMGELGAQCDSEEQVVRTPEECTEALKELGRARTDIVYQGWNNGIPAGCSYRPDASHCSNPYCQSYPNQPHFNTDLKFASTAGRSDLYPICRSFVPVTPPPSQSPTKSASPTTSPSPAPTGTVLGYVMKPVGTQCDHQNQVITTHEECVEALKFIWTPNRDIAWEGTAYDIPAGCAYRPAECNDPDCYYSPNQPHFNLDVDLTSTRPRGDLAPICRSFTPVTPSPSQSPHMAPSSAPTATVLGYFLKPVGSQCDSQDQVITSAEECTRALKQVGTVITDIAWTGNQNDIPAGCAYRPDARHCQDPDCYYSPNQPHFNGVTSLQQTRGRGDLQPVCRSFVPLNPASGKSAHVSSTTKSISTSTEYVSSTTTQTASSTTFDFASSTSEHATSKNDDNASSTSEPSSQTTTQGEQANQAGIWGYSNSRPLIIGSCLFTFLLILICVGLYHHYSCCRNKHSLEYPILSSEYGGDYYPAPAEPQERIYVN